MSVQLRAEDRRALDLLLDRGAAAAGISKSRPIYAAAEGVSQERLRKVETVLHLLEALPASDPPRDLVTKTLERIQKNGRGLRNAPDEFTHFKRPMM